MSETKATKVLHLTPHFGGGVGTVLLANLIHSTKVDPEIECSVLCLDYLNEHSKEAIKRANIPYTELMHTKPEAVLDQIAAADVTLIHWWNHPLLTDFLIRYRLPPCRLLMWCHITGSFAPNNLTSRLFTYPDEFIFTTPISYEAPEYKSLNPDERKTVSTIWSTAGVERLAHVQPRKHDGFHVGYLGSLDPTKIHPQFVELCKSINIPNVHFTVIGPENEKLTRQAHNLGMDKTITFTGFIPGSRKWDLLSTFNVFGYPLARHHFGSCDQTLQEAMALEVPPVVLNNQMERYMVKHGHTGLVVEDEQQYIRAIEELSIDHQKRNTLGQQAKQFAIEAYSIEHSRRQWRDVFDRVMTKKKSPKCWGRFNDESPSAAEIFVESLGDHAGPFQSYLRSNEKDRKPHIEKIKELGQCGNWTSPNKSTVYQFLRFFPEDKTLREWAEIMKDGML